MKEEDLSYLAKFFASYVAKRDPSWTVAYCASEGRNGFLEGCVMNNPMAAVEYARFVIKGRWPEAEPSIAFSDDASIKYSQTVLRGPFPLYESRVAHCPHMAVSYAVHTGYRIAEAEEGIARSAITLLFRYMCEVVKGRFPEAEGRLVKNPTWLWKYADSVLGGKLPEEMHAAMGMHSFAAPENKSVKKYFAKYGK